MIGKALLVGGLALVISTIGCSTSPKTPAERDSLHAEVLSAINDFKREDPSMSELFEAAHGYAVFPEVGKGAVGVGGAYGKGEVYERGELIGNCDLSQATIGLQLGGQKYSEIIFFQNESALTEFKSGEFEFAAQASAVAADEGASADADYDDGVLVFTMAQGGLMFEASIGGQKFRFEPLPD